ncbi:MAG: trehalase family glycosidase [Pseudomonadota bacterium]
MTRELIDHAKQVLRDNDRGHYTVPTHGLYPFQWNWDSALSALGFARFDEPRAWTEINTLMAHQWDDGMVPHIIFHQPDDGYFPGPEVWGTNRAVPTSGITQPPVTGFAVRRIFERAKDTALAERQARALLPKIHAWHQWFYRCRDPQGTGLVALLHPWESGRDNSADWDAAFARVPTQGVGHFTRRDTTHANPAHRPTDAQYQRYIWLVQKFRSLEWDNEKLHDASPFQVVDPGFNAILIRSCADVAALAEDLGMTEIASQSSAMAETGIAAMDTLWSEAWGQYMCLDRTQGTLIDSPSIAGILAVFAPIPDARAAALTERLERLAECCAYLIPSHDPSRPEFDGLRYWRGPVWLIVNYMVADGLSRAGQPEMVDRIMTDCFRLIERSGFAEYHDPITAEPCGGAHFTWTAAMVIEIFDKGDQAA